MRVGADFSKAEIYCNTLTPPTRSVLALGAALRDSLRPHAVMTGNGEVAIESFSYFYPGHGRGDDIGKSPYRHMTHSGT